MLTASQVPDETWLDKIEIWGYNYYFANLQGSGSSDDPYLIETPEQLALLAYDSALAVQGNGMSHKITQNGSYFKQTANIDLGGYEWIAIPKFIGTYDGGGYTISGLISGHIAYKTQRIISSDNNVGLGLFGEIADTARIENVNIKNSVFFSDADANAYYDIGCVCAYDNANYQSSIDNCSVDAYINLANNITYISSVGGILGCQGGSAVYRSTFKGSINVQATGSFAQQSSGIGGIIGLSSSYADTEVDGCSFKGEILSLAQSSVGGIIGFVGSQDAYIKRCIVSGVLQSAGMVGAICGDGDYPDNLIMRSCAAEAALIGDGNDVFTAVSGASFVGYLGCSFIGSVISNTIRMQPWYAIEGDESCYVVANGEKYLYWYESGAGNYDWDDWDFQHDETTDAPLLSQMFCFVDNLNSGYPIQRELYYLADAVGWYMQEPEFIDNMSDLGFSIEF